MKKFKTAMIFGVFDGLHEGHKHFISQAAAKCEQIIIVVTKDEIVSELKGRLPKHALDQRIEMIRSLFTAATIIAGDSKLGEWTVLREHSPEIIFLGYDQRGIAGELEKLGRVSERDFIFIDSHEPHKFKSSLLRKIK